ncbi:hypothetical protein EIP91_007795 [Steccherinum ochraceum]|uniref:Alpha-xenorhabdolysin family binary toxin subunit A n=1 Tax=Steccherinum ochraceum TaxID=92696 RepID=A0A4R0R3T3_9APHY|nr:hypothetical protein EIP91_007795 [Steccherinum ochraceum]
MSVPPQYQQTHRELQAAIDNAPSLSGEEQIKALQELTDDLNSPQAQTTLEDEVRGLSGETIQVNIAFIRVTDLFRSILRAGGQPAFVTDVDGLLTTWIRHHLRFIDLVGRSREVASRAATTADDFAQRFLDFLGDDTVPVAVRAAEIGRYIEVLDRDGAASQEMAQGFIDLERDIKYFKVEWGAVVRKYNINDLNRQIADLDVIIKNLEATLVDLDRKIKDLTIALSVTGAVTGVLGFSSAVWPLFSFAAAIGVASMAMTRDLRNRTIREREEVANDLTRNKARRAQLQNTIAALQQLKAGLESADHQFEVFSSKLGQFAQVWTIIRADVIQIRSAMHLAESTGDHRLFRSRINNAQALYSSLAKSLRLYQTTFRSDDPMFADVGKRASA